MKNFITNSIKGGLFFLLPLALVIILFEKLVSIIKPISIQIGDFLNINFHILKAPYLLTIILILFLFFLAGVIAKIGLGRRTISWIENNILTLFPGYQLIKTTYETKLGLENSDNFPVVLAPIDGWMFGLLVEHLDEKNVLVFVPSSPESWSGNLVIFKKNQLKSTTLQKSDLVKINRTLGIDSLKILKGKIEL
ncbi:MAG: hypothetical protein HWE15_07555 [Algoriphagus sp.]|uniref:hypothetical protein n=1 Tax=Algoriphagus sp. TaxID=1872435 RepID=UPI00184B9B0B|nr:hypothetical protein [Algoriphagus sp.]NVJ86146.1 hypothetical protein [Algoriphagus sp.]